MSSLALMNEEGIAVKTSCLSCTDSVVDPDLAGSEIICKLGSIINFGSGIKLGFVSKRQIQSMAERGRAPWVKILGAQEIYCC